MAICLLYVFFLMFFDVFWFVPCFKIDVNGICAIGATASLTANDWTGYNSLATKDQDRSPRGVGKTLRPVM